MNKLSHDEADKKIMEVLEGKKDNQGSVRPNLQAILQRLKSGNKVTKGR